MPRKKKHGGKREGAGRKPLLEDPIKILLRLEKRQHEKLKAKDKNVSKVIRQMVDDLPEGTDNNGSA